MTETVNTNSKKISTSKEWSKSIYL